MAIIWKYNLNWNANASVWTNWIATNVTWTNGKMNWCAETTWNGYIDVWDFYSWSGSYTIEWLFNSNVTATSWDYNIIYRYSNSSGYDTTRVYYGWYWSNQLIWKWCTWTTTNVNNTFTITNTFVAWKWYYMIFELDDTNKNANFYLNWVLHSTQSFTWSLSKSTQTTQKCSFGNRYYNADEWWDGKIDELIVHNTSVWWAYAKNKYLYYNWFM